MSELFVLLEDIKDIHFYLITLLFLLYSFFNEFRVVVPTPGFTHKLH